MSFKGWFLTALILASLLNLNNNLVYGSEGISQPLKHNPVISVETGKAAPAEKIPGFKKYVLNENLREKYPLKPSTSFNKLQQPSEKQGGYGLNKENLPVPISELLFRMSKAFAGVLILFFIFVGIVLLLRWIKSRSPEKAVSEKPYSEHEGKEPATVSEAVSSYIRHRLNK